MKIPIPPARILEEKRRKRRIRSIYRAWDSGNTARVYRLLAYATVKAEGHATQTVFVPFRTIEKPGGKILIRLEAIAPEYLLSEILVEIRDSDHARLAVIKLTRPDYTPGRDQIAITVTLGETDT